MTELASAYVTIVPSLKGAGKSIESQLGGVNVAGAGRRIGQADRATKSATAWRAARSADIRPGRRAQGRRRARPARSRRWASETSSRKPAAATDATQKFKSTLDFAGLGTAEVDALSKSTRAYADRPVYSLSDIQGITAQLAANSVPNYDRLAEAAGDLNAVAGGNAETYNPSAWPSRRAAGAGKLTTENSNGSGRAPYPGTSGKLQEAMPPTAPTRATSARPSGREITAEEFNQAIMDLGFQDAAVEAAKSTSTFEGAIGNLEAAFVGGLSDILTQLQPAITGALNAVTPLVEGTFSALSAGIGAAMGAFAAAGPALSTLFQPLVTAAQAAWAVVQPVLSQLAATLPPLLAQLSAALAPVFNLVVVRDRAVDDDRGAGLGGARPHHRADNRIHRGDAAASAATRDNGLVTTIQSAMTVISTVISTALAVIQAVWNAVWPVLQAVVTPIIQGISTFIQGAMTAIRASFRPFCCAAIDGN